MQFKDTRRSQCSVEGCDGYVKARNYCTVHYQRWYKYGYTYPEFALTTGRPSLEERLRRASNGKGLKTCSACKEPKSNIEFSSDSSTKDGMRHQCRMCVQVYNRSLALLHKSYNRDWKLKQRYGITLEDYECMQTAQGGTCAICDSPPEPDKVLVVDHDHATDKVRGLLCRRCNISLGAIDLSDMPLEELLDRIRLYLTAKAVT